MIAEKVCILRRLRILICLMILSMTAMMQVVPVTYAASSDDWFNKGNAYLKNKDYTNAIAAYTQAVTLEPQSVGSLVNRSIAYAAIEKYDESIADCGRALAIEPNHVTAYINRSYAYMRKGQYDQALADINRAITITPNFWPSFDNRASILIYLQKYDQAIDDCNTALKLNSKAADVYSVRGTAYRMKGQYEQALKDYNKALSLDSALPEAYAGRGYVYVHNGLNDKANEDFEKAKDFDPKVLEKIPQNNQRKSTNQSLPDTYISRTNTGLTDKDFALAGLTISSTKTEAIATFGQPTNVETFGFPNFQGSKNPRFTKYVFPDGTVTISDYKGDIFEITVTTPKYSTIRGIKVGDSLSQVREAYGKEKSSQKLRSGNMCYVYSWRGPLALSFETDSANHVVGISVDLWSD